MLGPVGLGTVRAASDSPVTRATCWRDMGCLRHGRRTTMITRPGALLDQPGGRPELRAGVGVRDVPRVVRRKELTRPQALRVGYERVRRRVRIACT